MKKFQPGERFNQFQEKKRKHEKNRKAAPAAPANPGLRQFGDRSLPVPMRGAQGNSYSTKMGTNPKYFKKAKKMKARKHGKNWIAGAIEKPGALHRELGVKPSGKIPAKALVKAAKKGGLMGKRARLAQTLKGLNHKGDRAEGGMKFGSPAWRAKYDGKKKNHKHEKAAMKCKTCGK